MLVWSSGQLWVVDHKCSKLLFPLKKAHKFLTSFPKICIFLSWILTFFHKSVTTLYLRISARALKFVRIKRIFRLSLENGFICFLEWREHAVITTLGLMNDDWTRDSMLMCLSLPACNIYKLTSIASWLQPWLMAASVRLLSLAWIYHQFGVGTPNDAWLNDFNTFAQQKHSSFLFVMCVTVLGVKTSSYIGFRQVDGQLLWGPFSQIHLLLPQVIKFHTVGAGLGVNLNTQHHVDAAERTELMF